MRSKRITRTCPTCGTLFETTPSPSRVASGRGKYCSRACPPYRKPLEERFWKNVQKSDGCWEWQGKCTINGYGYIVHNGKGLLTHRVSWELHKGPIPEGLVVCHHCDNRRCIRPDHLFVGTLADNNHDMMAKGRARFHLADPNRHIQRGVECSWAKLSESDVIEMRRLYDDRILRVADIARNYSVHYMTASDIVHRRKWTHVN